MFDYLQQPSKTEGNFLVFKALGRMVAVYRKYMKAVRKIFRKYVQSTLAGCEETQKLLTN